jgi:hypothetical protein
MADPSTLDLLNQLLALHSRSLPTYLDSARPWFSEPNSDAEAVLRLIAEDHRLMVDRIGTLILEHEGTIKPSEFSMDFTDMHDLSVDYLIPQVVARLEEDIDWIRRECVPQLSGASEARAIAEEALGAAQGHLDSLNELSLPA